MKNTFKILLAKLLQIFTWGATDANTLRHWVLGLALFAFQLAANTFLTDEQSALVSVFNIACVWEYQQRRLKKAKIDIKDIVAACLVGALVCLLS